jgi:hypothetical protein
VWSQYGAELADNAIAEGNTYQALDGPSFAALVESGLSARASTRSERHGQDALRTILESCPA